jgi:hypothetical protein
VDRPISLPRPGWTTRRCYAPPRWRPDPADIARGSKALLEAERGWRYLKQLELRPVYHRKAIRIVAHVQLSWLALWLIRTAEIATIDTWRNISHELDRIRLHTYDTGAGVVSRRTRLTAKQSCILEALSLSEPPRSYDSEASTTNRISFRTISALHAIVTCTTGPFHDQDRHRTHARPLQTPDLPYRVSLRSIQPRRHLITSR